MGIFDSIKNAIWGKAEDEPAAAPQAATDTAPQAAAAPAPAAKEADTTKPAPAAKSAPVAEKAAPAAKPEAPQAKPVAAAPAAAAAAVDVTAILDAAVKNSGQTLNWRSSIVDLMKALGLDSSLSARKELAGELGYTGDTGDSAAMNIWLHAQVLRKLADNGGTVPSDLL